MHRVTFVARTRIPASAEAVFDWHEAPGAFERLTPPWERVQGARSRRRYPRRRPGVAARGPVAPVAAVGARTSRLPARPFIHGSAAVCPFRSWKHAHRMVPEGPDACVLEDTIEYELPFGAIGRLFGRPFVQRKLKRLFAYRHAVTLRAFAGR